MSKIVAHTAVKIYSIVYIEAFLPSLIYPKQEAVSDCSQKANGPVLTSGKEEKHVILPITLNFVVQRGKLRSYTLQNPPDVF